MLPKDPYILLSMINMKLRDEYADLEDMCASLDIEIDDLKAQLGEIGYQYDPVSNQFKS